MEGEDSHQQLYYEDLGQQDANDTVVLIHGAFSSGKGWDLVIPHLQSTYRLLVPDLPGHGQSQHVQPFSKESSTRLIAAMIREKARGGKAHVIGFSLGAGVAVELASRYPEVVDVLFVSGFGTAQSPRALTYGLLLDSRLSALAPRGLVSWLMDGTDIQTTSPRPTYALARSIAEDICIKDDKWPSPWPARTLIVAAGKAGILPTSDSVDDARRLRDIALQIQPAGQTKAYTHPRMRHPWDRQAPELFVETVKQWFDGKGVPDEFIEL